MSYRSKKRISHIAICCILGIIAALTFFPYYFMLISSLKNNGEIAANPFMVSFPFRIENYASSAMMILRYFRNSIIVTGATVAGTTIVSVLSAYVFARFEFPGKKFLFMFILSFMMIPGILTLIPMYVMVSDMKLIGTFWAVILPGITTAQIQFIFILKPYIEGIPGDLFDAALLDGANHPKVFRYVISPLIKPTLFSLMLLAFLNSWNDFIWPMLTLSANKAMKTITLGLYSYRDVQQIQYGPMFAGFFMASVPLILLFSFNMKHFISGITSGAIKG